MNWEDTSTNFIVKMKKLIYPAHWKIGYKEETITQVFTRKVAIRQSPYW